MSDHDEQGETRPSFPYTFDATTDAISLAADLDEPGEDREDEREVAK